MKVTIKNSDRTSLNKGILLKLIKKYCQSVKQDIVVSFDHRIKTFGYYVYDTKKKKHIIKISVHGCTYSDRGTKLDKEAEKYATISTLLHELKHAIQKEECGKSFWNKDYSSALDVINPEAADFYSVCEIEARIYENKNILQAVEFYNSQEPQ
jgi:hypothetical protein